MQGWKAVIPYTKSWLRWVNPRISDENILEWLNTAGGVKMISRYPNITPLTTMGEYADLTKLANELDTQNLDCIPATFVFPGPDVNRFEEYKKAHPGATFIAKPDNGTGGISLALFSKIKDLPKYLQSSSMTVQRYIDKPLLVDGLKFNLNVYIVIVGFDPIHAFIFDEGLARFCTVPYAAPTAKNMG